LAWGWAGLIDSSYQLLRFWILLAFGEISAGLSAKMVKHELVDRCKIESDEASGKIETLSIDGGKVRLRTPLGRQSEWEPMLWSG
jgi:hypothetical protein